MASQLLVKKSVTHLNLYHTKTKMQNQDRHKVYIS